MICKCIETSETLPISKGETYDLEVDGNYFVFTNDFGCTSAATKEQFELYFEVIK